MHNQNYIRKGVKLAVGFQISPTDDDRLETYYFPSGIGHTVRCEHPPQCWLDALAAQLRLQAQSNPHIVFNISVIDSASFVEMLIYNPNGDEEAQPLRFVANETDEAMAFFKVIVDSKILEGEQNSV